MTALVTIIPTGSYDDETLSFGMAFNTGLCETCEHWGNPFFDGELGVCGDEMSDHFGHVTAYNHPFCPMARAKQEQAKRMKKKGDNEK